MVAAQVNALIAIARLRQVSVDVGVWMKFGARPSSSGSVCARVREGDVVHHELAAIARANLHDGDTEKRAEDGEAEEGGAQA